MATYSLHHLTDKQKIAFLKILRERLKEGGSILVGDVAFEDRGQLEKCRAEAGDEWDDEEFYWKADEMRKVFPELKFEKISFCAGVISINN